MGKLISSIISAVAYSLPVCGGHVVISREGVRSFRKQGVTFSSFFQACQKHLEILSFLLFSLSVFLAPVPKEELSRP